MPYQTSKAMVMCDACGKWIVEGHNIVGQSMKFTPIAAINAKVIKTV